VHRPANRSGDPFDSEQQRRRDEHEHQREDDRVPPGRTACREELAVLAEQVEERLRDRERPEHEQVQAGQPQRQGLPLGHRRGVAR
jgi:hypothetical protein